MHSILTTIAGPYRVITISKKDYLQVINLYEDL